MIIYKKYRLISALSIIMVLLFSSCASQSNMSKEAPKSEASISEQSSIGFMDDKAQSTNDIERVEKNSSQSAFEGRKIIKSGEISLETKEFDKTVDAIISKTNFIGGYVESSNVTGRGVNQKGDLLNRRARFSLRVPDREFEDFILDINTIGSVTNSITRGNDITSQYFDTEARVKTLSIQEERLLEILQKAEKVEDIIQLEKELSRIRYEIESLTGTLKKWDNLVNYSTLEVSVYEVQEVTEVRENSQGLIARMRDGFRRSIKAVMDMFKGLLIFIASLVPFTIIILPLGLFAFYILKYLKGKGNKSNKINKE